MSDLPDPHRIAFLGDYLPRFCGIETLCEAATPANGGIRLDDLLEPGCSAAAEKKKRTTNV